MKEIAMVQNNIYDYWYDENQKCMYAEQANTGDVKVIYGRKLSKDISVRKAIAKAYDLKSFREY